jgi:hypothetical protein
MFSSIREKARMVGRGGNLKVVDHSPTLMRSFGLGVGGGSIRESKVHKGKNDRV